MTDTIALVRESEATDERAREAFRDIKNSLRVPIVNLIFQAWAAVPRFLDVTWRRLRPNVLTIEFANLAARIGEQVRTQTASWAVGDHAASLRGRAVSEAEIARMREVIELFAEVNPKLAILASAVEAALAGESVGGVGSSGPHREEERERPREFRGVRFSLVEEREAPPRVRAIYEDMRVSLRLPFIETEYKAMASYPDWLEVWWRDCKPRVAEPGYELLTRGIGAAALNASRSLPHGLFLSEDLLSSHGIDDQRRADLRRVTGTFVRSLPGLIINVELARRGLG
ncbi:MAG TPA: halocarboxylic acid dehydrogenase DehI family protein [Candidatus Acidoferrales bacterium]|nr:halocarboxylic acid dehydrogenase DehI family protein [Candidatus Acidoferrales bacterium]